MSNKTKTIIVILLLVIFYPIGVILMWFWVPWPKWLKIVLTIPIVLILTYMFIARPFKNTGSSMLPTLEKEQKIVIDQISPVFGNLKRGDIVVFVNPRDRNQYFVKRIVSLPGERVRLSEGYVYINDNKIDEPYVLTQGTTTGRSFVQDDSEVLVPKDSYFLLGDNRDQSSDSRELGFIPKSDIVGKYWFKY